MRITFVAIGCEQLGVSLLASMARQQGHEVRLAFSPSLFNDRVHLHVPILARVFDDRKDVLAAIERQRPDVLAFSTLTGTYQWLLGIARDAKRMFPGVKTVFGGVHPSAVPERVLARTEVDYVCIGEGDVAFPKILEAIEKGRPAGPIVNTRYRCADGTVVRGPQAGFVSDLDALPAFDKTLWEDVLPVGDPYITMTARGCPYRCTFCFNSFFVELPDGPPGRYVRRRSVAHVMRELRAAKRRYTLNTIEFFDDVFTLDKKWLRSFLNEYKAEIGVPFQCFTHVNYIDEDVARWMADAGCFAAQIGVQSMDDAYKCRHIKRYERVADIERTVRIMNRFGVRPKFDHMFGLPDEPLEAQETAREVYTRTPPNNIQTYWTNYFPGTQILEQAALSGRLTPDAVERIEEGLDGDIYAKSNALTDPARIKAYHAYQVIFKLIPNVPSWLRRRLRPEFFMRMPVAVCSGISFLAEVLINLVKRSPDHIRYAKYYLYHMWRFVLIRCGAVPPPATRARALRTEGGKEAQQENAVEALT